MVVYKNTREEFIEAFEHHRVPNYGMNILDIFYKTDMDIIREYLPPPLKPDDEPLVWIWFFEVPPQGLLRGRIMGPKPMSEPSVETGEKKLEFAAFLACKYNDIKGWYCPYMYVTRDVDMAAGREIHGFPKKIVNMHMDRYKDEIWCEVERAGIKFVSVRAKLKKRISESELPLYLKRPHISLKFQPLTGALGFIGKPQLLLLAGSKGDPEVKEDFKINGQIFEAGVTELTYRESYWDPVYELKPVDRIIKAIYMTDVDAVFTGAKVLAECDPNDVMPFVCFRYR